MQVSEPQFEVRLAQDREDLLASQRLRYDVFVRELGGDGDLVDHQNGLEQDHRDPFYDHMILLDHAREDLGDTPVVGVYRVLTSAKSEAAGGFYTASEYDLKPILETGRSLLELGRSCLHVDYRGGAAMYHLWNGLAAYTLQNEIEVLFGVASFHGTDLQALAEPLSLLHHRHLAPPDLRASALPEVYTSMNLVAEDDIDRVAAMKRVPSLIKAYLRLGGFVGDGAFVDSAFNTTDVFLVLDTDRMNERQRTIYTRDAHL